MHPTDRYTYRISWSEEDGEYVATCAEFPSLSWLNELPEHALAGVRKVVATVLEDLEASGEPIPEPFSTKAYSGRFMARVPPHLHRQLAMQAAESGISLNRLVSYKLSHGQ